MASDVIVSSAGLRDEDVAVEEAFDPNAPVKLNNELDADHEVIRTKNAALPCIPSNVQYALNNALEGRVTKGAPEITRRSSLNNKPETETVKTQIAEETPEARLTRLKGVGEKIDAVQTALRRMESRLAAGEKAHELHFPNLGLEAVLAGLAQETRANAKLQGHAQEVNKIKDNMNLLLQVSAKLATIKDNVTEMPADLKALLEQLKERGIDLLPTDDKSFSKEMKSELKTLSGNHMDRLKTNLNIVITMQIQYLTKELSAMWEAIKEIIKNIKRQIDVANRLPGH